MDKQVIAALLLLFLALIARPCKVEPLLEKACDDARSRRDGSLAQAGYTTAALQGSSYYKLPRVLQWFSGNIGYHHVHHLSPRIPNYNLERCHNSHPLFQNVKPITLSSSLKSLRFRLWDEEQRKLVGFGHLAEQREQGKGPRQNGFGDRNKSAVNPD